MMLMASLFQKKYTLYSVIYDRWNPSTTEIWGHIIFTRLPHSASGPGVFMQLDFGTDVLNSTTNLWNHGDCCSYRIIGISAGITVFSQALDSVESVNEWEFGPWPRTIFRVTRRLSAVCLGNVSMFHRAISWVVNSYKSGIVTATSPISGFANLYRYRFAHLNIE